MQLAPAGRPPADGVAGGVAFPAGADGRRSASATARAAFAAAAGAVSPEAAAAVGAEPDWRHAYPAHVLRLVELGLAHGGSCPAMAAAGLDALHARVEFLREGRAAPLREAMADAVRTRFWSVTVAGSGAGVSRLEVPYRGSLLAGDGLRRQASRWVEAGIAEPSFAEAIGEVIDHPEWLDLSDRHIAVLGAGAELGPFSVLTRWRANLAAVDLPDPALWRRILALAEAGNAHVTIPLREPAAGATLEVAVQAGANLLTDTPEIAAWLAELPGPLCVGCHAYLDGEAHVRVALAMDAIVEALLQRRRDVVPAWLLTPTDVYAVPEPTARIAMRRWGGRGGLRLAQEALRAASGGRLFVPNVTAILDGSGGMQAGIADGLVLQQGPNYALAKRLQQWRALAARAQGIPVSARVAPATRTRSVVKNRALAAAYRGAHHFGVEVFEPETANALMAALLVRDLRSADPGPPAHPLQPFMDCALHGGLWTLPWLPRSALPVAALLGLF